MTFEKVLAERKDKVIYKDGDTTIKVFDSNYPKSDILNEALNHARVEETGLPIPAIKAVSVIDGKWAISIEYVEGKTLEKIMEEDPDNFDKYLEQFVDLQLMVQSKKAPLLNKLKDKMNRKISSLSNEQLVMSFIQDLSLCQSMIRFATAILTRQILSFLLMAQCISLTGHTLLRETLLQTQQEHIFCLLLKIRLLLISILTYSVKSLTLLNNMYSSGCR